jgi:sucrose-6-phosphate hydrolase SacC (GH32 family)
MRKYSLASIDSKATLVQEPYNLAPIEHTIYTHTWEDIPGSQFDLPVTGKAIDVTLTFNVLSTNRSATRDSSIQLLVRANADSSQGTAIGYDASTQQLFVDRRNSGDVSFNSVFPGIYYASLIPTQGKVTLRVLVDWSSVEVFGGRGESVITAQIFPRDADESMALLYTEGAFSDVSITVKNVTSTWN